VHPAAHAATSVEMAKTMAKVAKMMEDGVASFIKEATEARVNREAKDFAGKGEHTAAEMAHVEEKALAMSKQMLENLQLITQVAAKLEKVIDAEKGAATPVVSKGTEDGKLVHMQDDLAGKDETIKELEGEKRSLIESVESMLHNKKEQEAKEQLSECKATVDKSEKEYKSSNDDAATKIQQLSDDNSALASSLKQCNHQDAPVLSQPTDTLAMTSVTCEKNLADATDKFKAADATKSQLMATVTGMMRDQEALKAQVKGTVSKHCDCEAPATKSAAVEIDIEHMGQTVDIDQYIATSKGTEAAEAAAGIHPEGQKPAAAKEAAKPVAKKTEEEEEKPKPIILKKEVVQAADKVLSGKGVFGKYLEGDEKPAVVAKAPEPKSENPGIEAALNSLAETDDKDDGDDLAHQLLMQAAKTIAAANL